ncbi:hypothetical protein BXZ70DRAFT_46056 [Cristinia sonorae]|uniref:Integral membrane bound transporter domain-containing protein n=1 Tax=Cristinia sonorae TaxID=1940300 RepID=A0A8K0XX54_9AGAR|nr:hypothetical protein BXZ70DRAFT_46056 [Cristinia sonorae]
MLPMALLAGSIHHLLLKFIRLFVSKRSLARLLSTLLCSIIIVVRPFSSLGGSYPFLVLALKELVFSVQENLAQQLEATILNIMGALLGIGISTLAKFAASKTVLGSAAGRAICAVTLISICFIAGLIKSRLPRLHLSARISCFLSVWILTIDIGEPSRVLPDGGAFLWVTLTAAIVCLLSLVIIMLPFPWVSTNFEHDIASSFSSLHQCLSIALNSNFSNDAMPSPADREAHAVLHAKMLATSIKLNENYSQAAFEIRAGRISLRSIRPLITNIEHLRRELAWGMPLKQPPELRRHGSKSSIQTLPQTPDMFCAVIGPTAQNLGYAILNAMRCVETTVILAFRREDPSSSRFRLFSSTEKEAPWVESQLSAILTAQKQLSLAKEDSKNSFGVLFRDVKLGDGPDGSPVEVPKEIYDGSLSMIALLQMSEEMTSALCVVERLVAKSMESPSRLWLPRVSLAWLGVPPGPFISDDPAAKLTVNFGLDKHVACAADMHLLSDHERKQGQIEYARWMTSRAEKEKVSLQHLKALRPWNIAYIWNILTSFLRWLWVNKQTMNFRLKLWMAHRSMKNSHHLQHALKNAVGAAILTFPAFMPQASSGSRWYHSWHGQWATISYLWVLETNTGATWRTGYLRILGTCMGALYAFITWLICRTNPYALVVMLTVADIPITWVITKTNFAPLVVPCSVAIPPIALAKYFSPEMTKPIGDLALLRALMITTGMVAALLMNSLVFPRHCRVLFLSHTSKTFGLLSNLYLTLSHETFHARHASIPEERRKTLKLELQTRNELHRLSALITTMKNELGLLPVVANMQKILDLLTGLRKIRENIPRREAVMDVFAERRAFMSCVCILLFACQHVFRTREPLPQFLPSARQALNTLERHVHHSLHSAPRDDPRAFGVSLAYVFAEQETMRNIVDTLEKMLELSGELFGTSAWLSEDAAWAPATAVDEGHNGWFNTLMLEDV